MPATMKHSFANVERPQIPRSKFIRPTGTLTAFEAGSLVPIYIDEILPGDTVKIDGNYLARVQTLFNPAFANLYLDIHFFFCPARLLWENWEKFMGASDSAGAQTTDYLIPVVDMTDPTSFQTGQIGDFFGLPTNVVIPQVDAPNALPFTMYHKIWNEWYRDQNLQDAIPLDIGDGPRAFDFGVLARNKRKDYFTSALPYPQKGDAVQIPIGITAPVIGDGLTLGLQRGTNYAGLAVTDAGAYLSGYPNSYDTAANSTPTGSASSTFRSWGVTQESGKSGLIADLSDASAITINSLREAIAMQQMLERDARGGTRYTEILHAHFGVQVPDYRLQRTELLGMMSQRIDIRAVSQTSQSDTTPQATQAAYSVTVARNRINHSFVEHGYIMGIASVRHDIQYQQGMRKLWSRSTREDFYDPIFAHLGEQAILNKELYFANNTTQNNAVFGYQERWSEYRYFPSMITSQFRSVVSSPSVSMASWHLADYYGSLPVLNTAFITENPDMARIVAVTDEPAIMLDAYFMVEHNRPIPIFSTPGLDRI